MIAKKHVHFKEGGVWTSDMRWTPTFLGQSWTPVDTLIFLSITRNKTLTRCSLICKYQSLEFGISDYNKAKEQEDYGGFQGRPM